MQPAPATDISHHISRTRSVPHVTVNKEQFPDAPGPDARAYRQSRGPAVGASLGVAHGSSKRLSRTKSGFSIKPGFRAAAAAAAASVRDSNRPHSPVVRHHSQRQVASPNTPQLRPPGSGISPLPETGVSPAPRVSPVPSPGVLRPLSSNPLGGYASKHTSASNSVESYIPADGRKAVTHSLHGSARKELFQNAAQRFSSTDFASHALTSMRLAGRAVSPNDAMMDVDHDYEQREPSSSSHDAKLASRPSRVKTTPDAKRAQNRESAKRFRVAQKKRWQELQETVERKDQEISRLKNMLQEVTNQNIAATSRLPEREALGSTEKADSLTAAEAGMFVKLMWSPSTPEEERGKGEEGAILPPLAANIGSLYRVIVAKLDGYVLGNRHVDSRCGTAMGGQVGSLLWEHVHSSDVAHLRFTVVHAARMASVMNGEPNVFSYRRRQHVVKREGHAEVGMDKIKYMRMKGCLYPISDENGHVVQVLLGEFIEI
ncbi:unnamed protein product [Chondrus crispus]|uniref:BZIP domain-containing protein n=1 Tax=Chondrus crispus TaxID=2769 RepID=R7QI18_CHOCR|nr:unnamed protein product [Chondrus crispus]CDF37724.1 unnamed protein product [Chondrus crispus]|eukprot:XP_005717595.1 unnamed protein product [Chondrus crispus]